MKKLLYFSFILIGLMASIMAQPSNVYAAGCTPVYGGGTDCPPEDNLIIDKGVMNPETQLYVDNLTINDSKFVAGETINYRVVVENTNNEAIDNVTVTDRIPDYVRFVSGPGAYSDDSRTVTITIKTLGAGEKRTFDFNMRVVDVADLPKDKSVFCVVNTAEVRDADNFDSDTAQVCIEKQVLGVPILPETGPANVVVMVAGLVTVFYVGRKLTKISA